MTPSAAMDTAADTSVDTSVDTGADTGAESSLDVGQIVETGQPDGGTEPQESQPGTQDVTPGQPAIIDGKKLSPSAKAALDELQTKDPSLATEIRHALFNYDKFKREVPGGLAEVRQLRNTIQEIEAMGGAEGGVQAVVKEIGGWRQFDEQYMSGDPKILDFMLDGGVTDDMTPQQQAAAKAEAAEAFTRLAPAVFDRYADLDGPGFAHYIGKTVTSHALRNDIPLTMARLGDFLGDVAQDHPARQLFNKVNEFFAGLRNLADNPPAAKAKTATEHPQNADEVQNLRGELEKTKLDGRRKEWAPAAGRTANADVQKELARQLGGKKLDAPGLFVVNGKKMDQQSAFRALFGMEYDTLTIEHQPKLDAYLKNNDQAGFNKYYNLLIKKYAGLAITKALDAVRPAAAKPGPKPGTQRPGGPIKPPVAGNNLERVGTFNEIKSQINWIRTKDTFSQAEMDAGKVVLNDGRKVQMKLG